MKGVLLESNRPQYIQERLRSIFTRTPFKGPWSGNNQLGYLTSITNLVHPNSMIKLDEWGPPRQWTLSFSIEPQAQAINDEGYYFTRQIALVEVGAGGAMQKFEFDCYNGAQVTTVMNAIRVQIQTVFDDPGDAVDPPAIVSPGSFNGIALLGHDGRSTTLPATRTYTGSSTPGGFGSTLVPVPPFAGSLMLTPRLAPTTSTDLYSVATTLEFWSGPGPDVSVGRISGVDLLAFAPLGIQIPPNAHFARLSNGDVSLSANFVYSLFL